MKSAVILAAAAVFPLCVSTVMADDASSTSFHALSSPSGSNGETVTVMTNDELAAVEGATGMKPTYTHANRKTVKRINQSSNTDQRATGGCNVAVCTNVAVSPQVNAFSSGNSNSVSQSNGSASNVNVLGAGIL